MKILFCLLISSITLLSCVPNTDFEPEDKLEEPSIKIEFEKCDTFTYTLKI